MDEVDDLADVRGLLGQLVLRFAQEVIRRDDDDQSVERAPPAVPP
jgi:hypothetical protein